MRLFLAGLVWVVFVGGVAFYTSMSPNKQAGSIIVQSVQEAKRPCTCRVWTSFSASPDPFALTDNGEAKVLRVLLNGREILVRKGTLDGSSVQESLISAGLNNGQNELFIETTPPVVEHDRAHAARLQFESEGSILVDKTFWSIGGAPIVTSVAFAVEGQVE